MKFPRPDPGAISKHGRRKNLKDREFQRKKILSMFDISRFDQV